MKLLQALMHLLKKFGIKANKIELSANDILNLLAGNEINLGSKKITIKSDNFSVDANGKMTCNSANITGGKINVIGPEAGRETIKISNSSHPDEYTSLMPIGLISTGTEGTVSITCAGNVPGSSSISLRDKYGYMHLSPHYIESQYLFDNQITSMAPNLRIDSGGEFKRSTNTSSKRYKTDIKDIEKDELDVHKLYNLPVRQFKYKTNYFKNTKDPRYNKELIGFIAEEVAEIYPIAADYEKDKNGKEVIENWNERYIIPPMLKLIQELHSDIEQLKNELKEIKESRN